jgi:hypothetical protein
MDINTIQVGSAQRQTFVANFKTDVAARLNVNASRIQVDFIRAGSVTVGFTVLPSDTGPKVAAGDITTAFSVAGVSVAGATTTAAAVVAKDPSKYAYTLSSNWTECDTSCGQPSRTLSRNVTCKYNNGAIEADSKCNENGQVKPAVTTTCSATNPCNPLRPDKPAGAFAVGPSLLLGLIGLVLADWQ